MAVYQDFPIPADGLLPDFVALFQGAAQLSFTLEGRGHTPRCSRENTVSTLLAPDTRSARLRPGCACDYSPLSSSKRISTSWSPAPHVATALNASSR